MTPLFVRGSFAPALALAAVLLTGCAAPPSDHFYTLAGGPAPASVGGTAPVYIEMLAVNIPASVNRDQLVVGTGEGRVDVLDQHRWAGPLADEIGSALSLGVAARLGAIDVYRTPAPEGAAVYRISTNVQRFESVPGSYALVDAVWSVRQVGSATVLTCRSVLREDAGTAYETVVAGHRVALGKLADTIAAAVRDRQAGKATNC
ncbi:PqiC family protein [Pseudoduganella lutea]|uniref:Membrane integrity-associated transporter subunit PqiC n=1 Tax=Pseudoduganella lutea TaxID=321985 RepID=A0A4P6L3W7_9BURK|nr:PqiC family protein [Pseudoduganella lutea]QBE65985.1 membrane integrity-associated transporter subunit PqiC [Pseudoduganella lutea]